MAPVVFHPGLSQHSMAVVAQLSRDQLFCSRRTFCLSLFAVPGSGDARARYLRRGGSLVDGTQTMGFGIRWDSPVLCGTPAQALRILRVALTKCRISMGLCLMQFFTRREMSHLLSESKWPNQALEPTTTAVTICADAQIAPAVVVAHL